MISDSVGEFLDSIKSARSLLLAVTFGAIVLLRLGSVSTLQGTNGWDAVIPSLFDSLTLSLMTLGWLLGWLAGRAKYLSQEINLLRFGSKIRAFWRACLRIVNELFGTLVAIGLVVTGLGSSKGFSTTWSKLAKVSIESPSAYSTNAFAKVFAGPFLAVTAASVYAVLGLASIASVAVALCVTGKRKLAFAAIMTIGLWMVLSSFGTITMTPILDASLILSLGWALTVPNGVWIGAGFWLLLSASSFLILQEKRATTREFFAGRLGGGLVVAALASLAWIHGAFQGQQNPSQLLSSIFSGARSDLIGYVLIACIPVAIVSAYVARMEEGRQGFWTLSVSRYASPGRWFVRTVAKEIFRAMLLLATLGFVAYGILTLTGKTMQPTETTYLVKAISGLLVETVLLLSLAAFLFTTSWPLASAWTISASALMVMGYWLPLTSKDLNVLTPYSSAFPADDLPDYRWSCLGALAITFASLIVTLIRVNQPNKDLLREK